MQRTMKDDEVVMIIRQATTALLDLASALNGLTNDMKAGADPKRVAQVLTAQADLLEKAKVALDRTVLMTRLPAGLPN
jgi:hypothetical protein